MKTDYEKEDLTYEEISFNKEIPLNSSY
jgi:hypothetical protein